MGVSRTIISYKEKDHKRERIGPFFIDESVALWVNGPAAQRAEFTHYYKIIKKSINGQTRSVKNWPLNAFLIRCA